MPRARATYAGTVRSLDAARLALWCNAIADGAVPPDAVTHALGSVRLLAQEASELRSVPVELAALRADGGVRLTLVLPVSGDPGGLRLDTPGLARAVEAQAALVVEPVAARPHDTPRAWIPDPSTHGVTVLREYALASPFSGQEDVATCSRSLLQAMSDAATDLEHMDVAAGRERIEPSLRRAEQSLAVPPPRADPRAQTLLYRGLAVLAAVDAAQEDQARAWSSSQQQLRAQTLTALGRAARRAVEASVGPGWAGPLHGIA